MGGRDMSKLAEFLATVKRIEELTSDADYGLVASARAIPRHLTADVARMTLNESSYTGYRAPDHVKELFASVVRKATIEATARGKRECDHLLFQYSEELESLRAVLPSLAVQAAIEIGVIAREMKP
jgi:hypothetical protein